MPDEEYDGIVGAAVIAAAGAGPLIVIPFADPAAVGTIWTTMIYKICRRAGHNIDRPAASQLALAVGASAGAYWAGSKVLGNILSKFPLSMAPAIGANSLLNALFTLRLGNAMIDLMEKPQFDISDWAYIAGFLGDAMKPRPSVSEIQRVSRLLKRLRGKLAS